VHGSWWVVVHAALLGLAGPSAHVEGAVGGTTQLQQDKVSSRVGCWGCQVVAGACRGRRACCTSACMRAQLCAPSTCNAKSHPLLFAQYSSKC
jgi:hypothetical protein